MITRKEHIRDYYFNQSLITAHMITPEKILFL